MRAVVSKKGKGLERLLAMAKQMERKPFVKVGVLGDAQGSVRTSTRKETSVTRRKETSLIRDKKGKTIGARGNTGSRTPIARGNFGAGTRSTVATASINRGGGGLTNIELATIHEFGAPAAGIPSRPFLRSTFDAKKDAWNSLMARLVTKVVAGHLDVLAALELVGQRAAGDVRNRITQGGNFVPNKPATIRRKGSSKPLIDKGLLLQSISHQVVQP